MESKQVAITTGLVSALMFVIVMILFVTREGFFFFPLYFLPVSIILNIATVHFYNKSKPSALAMTGLILSIIPMIAIILSIFFLFSLMNNFG